MNIGILGGSFDPVHFGHLGIAEDARHGFGLDRVLLVPAAQAPLKPGSVQASAEHRLAMLRLAAEENPTLIICDLELRRGGTSYTIDTVRQLRVQYPEDRLFWIIGEDQLPRLPQWSQVLDLVHLVEFICLGRPGVPVQPPPPLPGLRVHRCPGKLRELSSTDIRRRIREGLALDGLMPHKAIAYLKENRLYLT